MFVTMGEIAQLTRLSESASEAFCRADSDHQFCMLEIVNICLYIVQVIRGG